MSFHRITSHHSSAPIKKKKSTVKKKPKWDDTVQDLTVLKATEEEINQRKAAHKSKNHMTYKLQQMRKGQKKDVPSSSLVNQNQARQLAIMKEILYDQRQLKNVLDKTDNMMAVVKDLFGDDPKKYTGFPNITTAPGASGDGGANRTATSLAPDMPEIYTKTEALSDSVMNPTALNDLPDTDSDDDDNPHPIIYQPQMNLKRFQQFLANEEKNQTLSSIGGQAQLSHNEVGPIQSTQIQGNSGFETPPNEQNDSMEYVRPPNSAINDTNKVKKSKSRVEKPAADTSISSSMNLTDMRKVLESLQDEIAEFEKQTGTKIPAEKQRSDTFSGYTVALVDAVSKLARYLRETDRRLQAEITVREQLTQDVYHMRNIIDALTSDIIVSQEEYGKSQADFERYKHHTNQEISLLKAALHGIGVTPRIAASPQTRTPPKHHPDLQFHELEPDLLDTSDIQTNSRPINSLPPHLQDQGAILLSPPVRKTRIHDDQQPPLPFQQKRQTSLIEIPSLVNGHQASGIPQVATVNVPRPISLAQQHLDIPLHQQTANSQAQSYNSHQYPPNSMTQAYGRMQEHPQNSMAQAYNRMQENPQNSMSKAYGRMQENPQNNMAQTYGRMQENPPNSMTQAYGRMQENPPNSMAQAYSRMQENPQNSMTHAYSRLQEHPQNSLSQAYSRVQEQPTSINYNPTTNLEISRRHDGMQTQIAELNKQHDEAQKRLQLLLIQQKQQKLLIQQDLHHGRGQSPTDVLPEQNSQSVLNRQKELIQQQQEIAHLLERQSQSFVTNVNNNNNEGNDVNQQDMLKQQEHVMRQMHEQMKRIQDEQRNMGFDIHHTGDQTTAETNNQQGRHMEPDGLYSPPISPISQKSDTIYTALPNQYTTQQRSTRDIKVSLPMVDLDTSI